MGVFLLLDTPYACTSQGKDRVLATRGDRGDRGDPHSGFSGSFMLAMAAGPLRSCSRTGRIQIEPRTSYLTPQHFPWLFLRFRAILIDRA